jgi:hypothetical protein
MKESIFSAPPPPHSPGRQVLDYGVLLPTFASFIFLSIFEVRNMVHCSESQPDYLPALRGLGESLLALAHQFIDTFVDKNAVDCAEQARARDLSIAPLR